MAHVRQAMLCALGWGRLDARDGKACDTKNQRQHEAQITKERIRQVFHHSHAKHTRQKPPYTPQGTSGLMTVPASSMVRARFLGCRPRRLYSSKKALPDNNKLKYCSPTSTLMPSDVKRCKGSGRHATTGLGQQMSHAIEQNRQHAQTL